jgi:ankyrin repeat protein
MRVISFDPNAGNLVVELPGFPGYEVFDVPVATYEAMVNSPSPQAYFNEYVWGNNFEHNAHWTSLNELLEYMSGMMFDAPVSVKSTKGDGDTPLHTACVWGDIGAIDLLLAGGADVNARGDQETTPLYNAVSFQRVRSVERLLRAGATADDSNLLGFTARQRALSSKNQRLISLFGAEA